MQQLNFQIQLPVYVEELADREVPLYERRRIIQTEILKIVDQEELRLTNWKRYVAFLKKYKISHRSLGEKECLRRWRKTARVKIDKDVRPLEKITGKTLGIATAHCKDEESLCVVKSEVQDRLNRNESPTCYILSLMPR